MHIINQLKEYLDVIGIDWALCGGYAIDMFVGKQTRNHKDIDVSVYWKDRAQIIDYMLQNNWRIFEPDGGKLREITNATNDFCKNDNIWCLTVDNTNYKITHINDNFYDITTNLNNQDSLDFIEFLFNDIKGNNFLYKRNHNIVLDLNKAVLVSSNNIQYLAPEMVLLYKSIFTKYLASNSQDDIDMVKNYRQDFNVSIPLFSKQQVKWLYNALIISYKEGHEWVDILSKYMEGAI